MKKLDKTPSTRQTAPNPVCAEHFSKQKYLKIFLYTEKGLIEFFYLSIKQQGKKKEILVITTKRR